MKVIGFNIHKISIERFNPAKGEINIQSKLDIEDIAKEDISISKNQGLKFSFVYNIDYEPKIAKIEIKGSIITLDETEESKEILKEWKAKKQLTHEYKINLFNFILNRCNLKALLLEEEIGLPLHVPFPKLVQNEKTEESKPENKAKYTG